VSDSSFFFLTGVATAAVHGVFEVQVSLCRHDVVQVGNNLVVENVELQNNLVLYIAPLRW
jgi:hypothetical protein